MRLPDDLLNGVNSLLGIGPLGIPSDLPKMVIRILKITRVAAPKSIVRFLHDDRSGIRRLLHDRIHFCFRGNIVADAKFRGTAFVERKISIFG